MAQVKAQYEALEEFSIIAKKIVEKYDEKFHDIDVNLIRAYQITNKERSEKNTKLFDLKPVQMPLRLDSDYSHYVVVYHSDWEVMEDRHKYLLVAQALHGIAEPDGDPQTEEGKVNTFDMKDYASMLRTFGCDYLVRDDVPDILNENVEWRD